MAGMELYQFVSFLRQLGLALAGAASLWGMVFIYLAGKKAQDDPGGVVLAWLGERLRILLYAGGILALVAWSILTFFTPLGAHEGVTLVSTRTSQLLALRTAAPVYLALAAILFAGLSSKRFRQALVGGRASLFYLLSFIVASIAASYYTELGSLPASGVVFHLFHGLHSIFTLGTVLTLDFMYLLSRASSILKQHVFPLFPQISKVIWVGLSLDLLSALLISPDTLVLSPRFFFAQTVVGIIIINGVLLSGLITRRSLALLTAADEERSRNWALAANAAGVVSVTSWTSITFVDFFPSLELSYATLMGIYLVLIATLFLLHELWEH